MPTLRASRAALATSAALLLGLTGACEPDEDEAVDVATETPTPTPTPTATPTPTPAEPDDEHDHDQEQFEGGTADVELQAADEQETAVLSEVRVARRDGYDRVVWEFSEGTDPRVLVGYEDAAREPGSGDPVDLAGDAVLVVLAQHATDFGAELYAPQAEAYEGPERIDGGNANITEVVRLGDFEAAMTWAVGLDTERPFRVLRLDDPLRLVVDIGH